MALTLNVGSGAIALVQNGVIFEDIFPTGVTRSCSLPAPSTAGTCIVAILSVGSTDGTVDVITSAPSGWTKLVAKTERTYPSGIEIWVYLNNPGGIQNVNFGVTKFGEWITHLSEWSNVAYASALEASGSSTAAAGTTLAPTTTSNVLSTGDLAITAWLQILSAGAVVSYTSPAGFTRLIDDGSPSAGDHLDVEYKLNPATGATLGPTLTSNQTTHSAAGAIVVLKAAPPVVDQTAFLRYGSMTCKANTFDFALVDPATVPSVGDPVALTTPNWNGRVVSVTRSDIVDRGSGHKLISIAATNQTVVATPTPTLVQSGTIAVAGATTISPTLPVASTAGNCLVAYVTEGSIAVTTTAPANWVRIVQFAPPGVATCDVWIYPNNPGSISSAVFGGLSAVNTSLAQMSEWSGVLGLVDQAGVDTALVGTTLAPSTSNTTASGDLAISGWNQGMIAGGTVVFTTPVGWTRLNDNGATSAQYHLDLEYMINPAKGATLGPTLTSTGTSGRGAVGAIVALKSGTWAPFNLTDTADSSYRLLLEDGTGDLLLEDGSGYLLLENVAASYRGLSVRVTQNTDGTITTQGSLTTFQSGLAVGQAFYLTSANLGYSAQAFVITNVTITWQGLPGGTVSQALQSPVYMIDFGDAYLTMQKAGGGVLANLGTQASTQQGTVMPAGTLGYAQVTTAQGPFTAQTDLTNLTVTVNVVSGRRIRLSAFANLTSSVSGDTISLYIMEGATILQIAEGVDGAAGHGGPNSASIVLQPSAGSHTYKVAAIRQQGTGNINLNASSVSPAYLLAEDIGT